MKPISRLFAAAVLGGALFAAGAARADPPTLVGRVSWLAGSVTLTDAGQPPTPAQINWPVTAGQQITTAPLARSELWIGSTAVRLDVDTTLAVEQVDEPRVALRLGRGSLSLRVAAVDPGHQTVVDTPLGAFRPTSAGEWRIDVHDGVASATAQRGTLAFDGGGTQVGVRAGQRTDFVGSPGRVTASFSAPLADDFQAFVAGRDAAFDGRAATRYVSPEMTGVESLDAWGHWQQTAEYGTVWVPAVDAGWAPYRYGRWAWVDPWGWTWVDDAPWGFAPFHYGRWALWGGRWAWVPGSYVARPVYAPALVAWSGGAPPAAGVSIGVSAVGWFPLAPHEAYVPPFAASQTWVRNVNVTHVTNITNVTTVVAPTHYAFQDDRRAATVVSAAVLAHHEPVAHAAAGAVPRAPTPHAPPTPQAVHPAPQVAHAPAPAAEHAPAPPHAPPAVVAHPPPHEPAAQHPAEARREAAAREEARERRAPERERSEHE